METIYNTYIGSPHEYLKWYILSFGVSRPGYKIFFLLYSHVVSTLQNTTPQPLLLVEMNMAQKFASPYCAKDHITVLKRIFPQQCPLLQEKDINYVYLHLTKCNQTLRSLKIS